MNRDPLGKAGGINMYGFVQNNPLLVVDPWGLTWQQDVEFIARGVGAIVVEVHIEAFRQAGQVVATSIILGRINSIAQLSHLEAAVLENSLKAGDILNRVGGTGGRDLAQRIDSKIQAIRNDVYGTTSTSRSMAIQNSYSNDQRGK